MNCIFRQAHASDLEQIMGIIRDAQAMMGEEGRTQWQDGYPAAADIMRDLEKGYGYVLADPSDCGIQAYGAVVFDGEPTYDVIDGKWLSNKPFVVVHRQATARALMGHGLGAEFLKNVESLAASRGIEAFRIDTNYDNRYMLRLLEKQGFSYCGIITLGSGDKRMAFEKEVY